MRVSSSTTENVTAYTEHIEEVTPMRSNSIANGRVVLVAKTRYTNKYRNSNSAKVDVDELAKAIQFELDIYKHTTMEDVENATINTANIVVKELRNAHPPGSEKYGKWDAYRKGWKAERETQKKAYRMNMIVHNKTHYRLAHLLEKGHALVGGGRTKAFEHIRPIQQRAEDIFVDEIIHELERRT